MSQPMSRRVIATWYRSLLPSGSVWCESSHARDFAPGGIGALGPVQDGQPTPLTFQRFEIVETFQPWESWDPTEAIS